MTAFQAEWILIVGSCVFVYGKYPSEERCYYKPIYHKYRLQELGILYVPLVEIYSKDGTKCFVLVDLSAITCRELRYVLPRPYFIEKKQSKPEHFDCFADYYKEDGIEYDVEHRYLPKCETTPYVRFTEDQVNSIQALAPDRFNENVKVRVADKKGFHAIQSYNMMNGTQDHYDSPNKYISSFNLISCDVLAEDYSWLLCDKLEFIQYYDEPLDLSCPFLPACGRELALNSRWGEEVRTGVIINNSGGKIFECASSICSNCSIGFVDPLWQRWFPNLTEIHATISAGLCHPGCGTYGIDCESNSSLSVEYFKNILQQSPKVSRVIFLDPGDNSVILQMAKELLISHMRGYVNAIVSLRKKGNIYLYDVGEKIRMIANLAHFFGADAAKEILSYQ